MADLKVAPEAAIEEFNKMCASRRIEIDGDDWTPEDRTSFAELRKRICKSISSGDVRIEDGVPVFKFGNPPLKLGRVKGSSLVAQDGKVGVSRIFAGLADISGMDVSHFSNFDKADLDLLSDFYVLFFAR